MKQFLKWKKNNGELNIELLFIGLVIIAIVSRLYNLNFQSYWYDELYIMDVSNPRHSFGYILEAMKIEFHPPFHYIGVNVFFNIFGYTDFTGRLFSVIIGVSGIIAMYFFGNQIKNKKTGLLMALITTLNYHHLYHSQEVRMYISLFLFTTLSALFLLKLIKKGSLLNFSLYILFVTLNLYTHYFSFFVFGAQLLFLLHVNLVRKEKVFFRKSLASICIIFISYLPWIPMILSTSGKSHWMTIPKFYYFFQYLYNQLGKEPVSFIIYLVGVFLFIRFMINKKTNYDSDEKLTGYYLGYSLFFIYVLTYFVSFFKPILLLRCTISALPFLIAVVVYGVNLLKSKISNILYSALIISSTINLLLINNYYNRLIKADFRGVVELVKDCEDSELFLSAYATYHNYYIKQLQINKQVIFPEGKSEDIFTDFESFYILNSHNDSNVMTIAKYESVANYIDDNFQIDTVIYSNSKTENIVKYTRKN